MRPHLPLVRAASRLLLLSLLFAVIPRAGLAESRLTVGANPPAVSPDHFPSPAHAVVFRNWHLVEPARLAAVLETEEANIHALAESMGLPAARPVPADYHERMYITLLRRNWHLLPYEQLLELLDFSEDRLAFALYEDDFLFIKLGSLKPAVDPVRYVEPDEAARRRAAEIRELVQHHFGDALHAEPAEKRFAFIDHLADLDTAPPPPDDPAAHRRDGLRYVYSYVALFGDPLASGEIDPFPDGLLARLADVGVNGVWLHVVLRDLAPGGETFPEFGDGHAARLAGLRDLVERADRYGIGIYLYINEPRAMPEAFFDNHPAVAGSPGHGGRAMCTSAPQVRDWLGDSLTHVFTEVPDLAGVFTITASENLTNCASHGNKDACPRCADRSEAEIIAEVNQVIEQGVHAGSADARVIAWDWGWNGHGDAAEHIEKLPDDIWLMSVSEWSLPIERGGIETAVGEYSLSAVGPGPRALRHWRLAQQRELKTVAKMQINNTWELSSLPYLPVMELVAEHCANLAAADVDGAMLSWTLGGYPSPNLRIAQRFADDPDAEVDAVLNDLARQRYGEAAAAAGREAWRAFSRGFREYPYHIGVVYNGPQQMGPANPLYAEPTGYAATMTGIPYDDLARWRGPYPAEVFIQQMRKVAEGFARGRVALDDAMADVPPANRAAAEADLRIAHAAELHFASVANQARFVQLRDAVLAGPATDEQRDELHALLNDEIALARQLFDLTRADSRIGYEAANQYFYTPLDLVEKVITVEHARRRLAN